MAIPLEFFSLCSFKGTFCLDVSHVIPLETGVARWEMRTQMGWGWVPGSDLQIKLVLQLPQVHPVVQGSDIMPVLLGDCGL